MNCMSKNIVECILDKHNLQPHILLLNFLLVLSVRAMLLECC
jgi:hypothetical protein